MNALLILFQYIWRDKISLQNLNFESSLESGYFSVKISKTIQLILVSSEAFSVRTFWGQYIALLNTQISKFLFLWKTKENCKFFLGNHPWIERSCKETLWKRNLFDSETATFKDVMDKISRIMLFSKYICISFGS